MDKSQIVASLDDFMSSNVRKTVTLKGPWGCGKTHFWKEYVCKTKAIREKKISYISLFDVSSIKEVKSKLIVSSLVKDTNGWRTHIKSILAAAREQFGKIPYLGSFLTNEATLGAIEDLYLKDFLICIDDIERRSSNLEIRQVLGFISVLRENRNCRVVLIVNEEQLGDSDREVLNQYRDKIIDMELFYSPTVQENAEIAFPNHELKEELLRLFEQADINNIRIMQKTIWRLERLYKVIPQQYEEARKEIGLQLAILCSLHYSEDGRVDINKIQGLQSWHHLLPQRDPQDENVLIEKRLELLGWNYPEYADVLGDAVLHESFHVKNIQETAEKVQKSYQDAVSYAEIEQPFEKFRSNFQGDINEIQNELHRLLDNRMKEMSWNQLGQMLSLLKDLGSGPAVAEYQKKWIIAHPEISSDKKGLDYILPAIQDEDLKNKLEEDVQKFKQKINLVDCMKQIAVVGSWGDDESQALKTATKEDFVVALTTSDESELISLVHHFLTMVTSFGRKDEDWASVADRILSALIEIARISKLNRIRVKNFFGSEFGLDMENDTNELADSDPNQREETGQS